MINLQEEKNYGDGEFSFTKGRRTYPLDHYERGKRDFRSIRGEGTALCGASKGGSPQEENNWLKEDLPQFYTPPSG